MAQRRVGAESLAAVAGAPVGADQLLPGGLAVRVTLDRPAGQQLGGVVVADLVGESGGGRECFGELLVEGLARLRGPAGVRLLGERRPGRASGPGARGGPRPTRAPFTPRCRRPGGRGGPRGARAGKPSRSTGPS